jgi:hypothetical protein
LGLQPFFVGFINVRLRIIIVPLLFVFASGCGQRGDEQGNSIVTSDEAEQLDKAAAKLDQSQPPPRVTEGELPKAPLPPADGQ